MQARPADAVRDELLWLLPPGEGLARDLDSVFAGVLAAPAAGIAAAEQAAMRLSDEIQPGLADALLEDFQRVLGPDPCGRDQLLLSLGDVRTLTASRWIARGGQTPAYFIALAASLGTNITIDEQTIARCGRAACGDELATDPEQFIWVVNLPASRLIDPMCAAAECGDLLGDFAPNLCECAIRLAAPAHTTVVFSYGIVLGEFVPSTDSLG